MVTERINQIYHGYKIVVTLWHGKYQGKAYFGTTQWNNSKSFKAIGISLESALISIREKVDLINLEEGRDSVALHKAYLSSIGKPYQGYLAEGRTRTPTKWKCFSCESHFDGFMGILCTACQTEACPNCGACHCGYLG